MALMCSELRPGMVFVERAVPTANSSGRPMVYIIIGVKHGYVGKTLDDMKIYAMSYFPAYGTKFVCWSRRKDTECFEPNYWRAFL